MRTHTTKKEREDPKSVPTLREREGESEDPIGRDTSKEKPESVPVFSEKEKEGESEDPTGRDTTEEKPESVPAFSEKEEKEGISENPKGRDTTKGEPESVPEYNFPVLAEKSLKVTNEEQHFVWDGYGLRLHIPHNSLPDDCSHCHLKIAVSLAGHFELPEDGVLVSAAYSFTHDLGDRKLRNPVTLAMQHCATNTVLTGLRFVKANTDSNKLEVIQGGDFQPGYAVKEIDRFSSFGLWLQNRFYFTFHSLDYRAKLYYTDIEHLSFKSNFYILPNLDANFKSIEGTLKPPFDVGPESSVEFEDEKIEIDIDSDGVSSGDWILTPLNSPVIHKRNVDRFPSRMGVQSCQIDITWEGEESSKVNKLRYKMKLKGAGKDHNFFNIMSPTASTRHRHTFSHSMENPGENLLPSGDNDTSPLEPATFTTGVPLPELLQLNVPQQIGTNYKEFGTLLLNDGTGNLVNNISAECQQIPEKIIKILEEWIAGRGKPCTWETLIEVLRECELNTLADRIKDTKLH